MSGYRTPEEAVRAAESVPPEYARVVAVEFAPTGSHAVVFIAYNEPPDIEPYVVLCEKTTDGWNERSGGSGGGISWMSTSEDGATGVRTTWDPPAAEWDMPHRAWETPDPDVGDGTW
jgi:hypothetical protein